MEIPDIEKASTHDIKAFQEKELKKMLEYLLENSKFYQEHFRKYQINIEAINSLESLSTIPPVGKKELQDFNQDFYCVSRNKIIDYCNTSGTDGEPVNVPLSEQDLQRLAYNEALSLACTGASKGDVFQLTTTVDKRFMAGLAYTLGARYMGVGMIRVGPGVPELQWKTVLEIHPNTLIIVPSFLLKMIEYAEKKGIDFRNSSVKNAVCIGEPIRHADFSFNALGRRIKEKWDIGLYSTYASSEMATAFTECEMGMGGHSHPELIITELLDENNELVPDGSKGELTITTLGMEAMPLLRFKTGDICVKHIEPCQCGKNTYRIGPILGRKNQMIKYKGTTVYPPALFDILDNMPEISSYLVEVYSNEFNNDEILVKYARSLEQIDKKALVDHFKTTIRVTPKLEEIPIAELHQLMFPQMSRKPIKFIDRRENNL